MNFKILLLALLLNFGCGVKSNPLSPPDRAIQSYIDSYTGTTDQKVSAPPILEKKK